MGQTSDFVTIADGNRPNAGRVYDYVLGGNHNFEIDRQAADKLLKIVPSMGKLPKLIRWFLGEAVRRLAAEGFNAFIDFASGLPTVDHIHQITPRGTKVIYSDIDPVTVAYSRDILGNNPDVQIIECNASKPEVLLGSDVVKRFVEDKYKIALGYNGIAWFTPDEQIAHFMEVTYKWAATGTKLYLCDTDSRGEATAASEQINDIYKQLNQPVYSRSNETLKKLIKPWTITEPGFMPLEKWVGIEAGSKYQKASAEALGLASSGILGAILVKE
jgi:hypothetical protein